ncbi:MAG: YlmC/YmxH family sporulation protein [Clostridia bacterium]|nr:YlmC/YmxH family sporulation protein [Oscillospiraceae bacterium]MBR6694233.1 YlmC/YmxH family sporulation protein [Clostridia bacterium]
MCCRIIEMRDKQVICIKDGTIIGCVCDVEIDVCSGKLVSIVIYGRPRCFGLFGRCEDIVIPWKCIEIIGADTILVNFELPPGIGRKKKIFPF